MATRDEAWRRLVARWLRNRFGRHLPCPLCKNETWNIGSPAILHVVGFPIPKMITRLEELPVAHLTCTSCGNVILIDSRVMNAIGEPDDAPGDPPLDREGPSRPNELS